MYIVAGYVMEKWDYQIKFSLFYKSVTILLPDDDVKEHQSDYFY